jgi:hypothetical protein
MDPRGVHRVGDRRALHQEAAVTRTIHGVGGSLAIAAILLSATGWAPRQRRGAPLTYDCDPGIPDPGTGSCDCPDNYAAGVHDGGVPFCRKLPGSRARPAKPSSIAAVGDRGPAGFDHGMQTTRHCGNHPEAWVRGSARLDTGTGTVVVDVELETDSTLAGPRGTVAIEVLGDGGKLLATIASSEVGIGGKPPGKAVSRRFSSQTAVRDLVAKRATALTIRASCTGTAQQLFGIGGDPTHAFGLTVK